MKRRLVGPLTAAAVSAALLATAGTALLPGSDAPLTDEEVAEELVATWIGAVGGLEAYWPLQSARYTLTTEIYDPTSGRLRRTRPRYVALLKTPRGDLTRIERWEGNDFIQQGWNGEAPWALYNGEPLAEGQKDFDEVLYVAGDVNYWIALPYKLHDPGVNLHYRERDADGRHVVGVSFGEGVGLHDGDTWQYWFEDGRTWPVQVAYKEEGKDNWNYLSFQDVRTVNGYTYVGRRVHHDEQGRLTKVLYTHDFEFNPDLGAGYFDVPR